MEPTLSTLPEASPALARAPLPLEATAAAAFGSSDASRRATTPSRGCPSRLPCKRCTGARLRAGTVASCVGLIGGPRICRRRLLRGSKLPPTRLPLPPRATPLLARGPLTSRPAPPPVTAPRGSRQCNAWRRSRPVSPSARPRLACTRATPPMAPRLAPSTPNVGVSPAPFAGPLLPPSPTRLTPRLLALGPRRRCSRLASTRLVAGPLVPHAAVADPAAAVSLRICPRLAAISPTRSRTLAALLTAWLIKMVVATKLFAAWRWMRSLRRLSMPLALPSYANARLLVALAPTRRTLRWCPWRRMVRGTSAQRA